MVHSGLPMNTRRFYYHYVGSVERNWSHTILYMAALSSVPDSVKEAAEIDGASAWQRFIKITVPMLAPTTTYISIMLLIGYLQLFEEPFMLTGGGPVNSTTSIVMLIYNEAFKYF